MSDAQLAKGVLLKVGNAASPEVFTAIAEVTGVGGPEEAVDPVEVTHTESPSDTKEFIAGLIDSGEISVSFNFLPNNATQSGLRTKLRARAAINIQLVFPVSPAVTFSMSVIITAVGCDTSDIQAAMTGSATFKITGPIS